MPPARTDIPLNSDTRETFWRTLQTFCVTRIVIAVVLLAYVAFNQIKDARTALAVPGWETCLGYLALAIGFAAACAYRRRHFMWQLLSQIVVDLVAISLLYVAAGGARSGLAILYLFPLAGAAILAPLVLALFFVSLVTLLLLFESGWQLLQGAAEVSPSQAGLYGAAFFAAIFLINRLAARLIREEDLAARRGQDLHLQEAVNQLVIADMDDGVLVVNAEGRVVAGNPAAERMLGLPLGDRSARPALHASPALAPIAQAFDAWRVPAELGGGTQGPFYIHIKPDEGAQSAASLRQYVQHLKLRFVNVQTPGLADRRTVVFLQDVSEIENRAQQLKLASMGRLTASIAHEVRNPLSAISHATSLLAEDIVAGPQARLLRIVSDNADRLNRMIEDILKLSRKAQAHGEPIMLAGWLPDLLAEFREVHKLDPQRIHLGPMHAYQVRFDPMHLREVLVNLLTNALRYASQRPGSIRVHALAPQPGRLELHVQDDGSPISPEVRAHLFEPFYTTSSRGTGLGLYVARELCLNNGAMLDYEYRAGGDIQPGGRFVITFGASGAGA
ncbi:sensor histidine kinase [Noviherbaspirillum aridicola]|uniref:histidine kinase n=1 Tax=Noviherbaspirillum aridicola TaxID=2849687 RepID=A0ABQ4Q1Q3_9BURK|nr:two-component sensor histidine kinase [Noviherbaspirillum aridicola]